MKGRRRDRKEGRGLMILSVADGVGFERNELGVWTVVAWAGETSVMGDEEEGEEEEEGDAVGAVLQRPPPLLEGRPRGDRAGKGEAFAEICEVVVVVKESESRFLPDDRFPFASGNQTFDPQRYTFSHKGHASDLMIFPKEGEGRTKKSDRKGQHGCKRARLRLDREGRARTIQAKSSQSQGKESRSIYRKL